MSRRDSCGERKKTGFRACRNSPRPAPKPMSFSCRASRWLLQRKAGFGAKSKRALFCLGASLAAARKERPSTEHFLDKKQVARRQSFGSPLLLLFSPQSPREKKKTAPDFCQRYVAYGDSAAHRLLRGRIGLSWPLGGDSKRVAERLGAFLAAGLPWRPKILGRR